MKRKVLKPTTGLIFVLFAFRAVGGDSIAIQNHSFEQPGTGEEITDFSQVPGWSFNGSEDTGINSFDGATDGSWCCSLGSDDEFVYQLTGHSIEVGDYELRIDAKEEGSLQMELYFGSTTLATRTVPVSGGFSTKTLSVSVTTGSPAVNQTLGIRFKNTQSDTWTVVDNVRLMFTSGAPDTEPPAPDPLTWAIAPVAASDRSVSMSATPATDPSGVEYYFDETSGNSGGTDSGWQSSPDYTDDGLLAETEYCYRVKARDSSENHNETAYSSIECTTTPAPDTSPPSPDPMTWASPPSATGSSIVEMTATTVADSSGVEYYFDETSGNRGGTDSGWQDSPVYIDTGLSELTQYCYRVKARDKSSGQNETAYSSTNCATTPEAPEAPVVVYPRDGSGMELLAAREVRRYIYLRTDQVLQIQSTTNLPAAGDVILVAVHTNRLVAELSPGYSPSPGEILLKTVNTGGRNILVITGYDPDATLVAAYRFAEKLGCSFDLAGDIVPDQKIPLSITGYDEVGTPNFGIRGIQPFHDFFQGPDVWSTRDYKAIISQLPKLGMNFMGLKTYPKHSLQEEVARDLAEGPEATVWVGLPEDVNADGTVKWSYPAYYSHTKRPNRIWGYATQDTDQFHCGSQQLFAQNGWGSGVMGDALPAVTNLTKFDVAGFNAIFNRNGAMFREAFARARDIGVRTCVGTELPMGLEPAGGEEVKTEWVRGMPPELQEYLKSKGKDPADPAVVKDIYKGIFTRIMQTHDLDYYWLWTYEVWQMDETMTAGQIAAVKADIELARQALNELGNPFELALAGWMLGSYPKTDEFDNPSASPFLPYDVPFMSLWDEAMGHDELHSDRVKWPATWFEEDWGLCQPQLGLKRIYSDAKASVDLNCEGFLAKHWRTKILSPNSGAMKDLTWNYGTTASPPGKGVPSNVDSWIDQYWQQWADEQFGTNVGSQYAGIMAAFDKAGEPGGGGAIPSISTWDSDIEDHNSAPAAIGLGEDNIKVWSSFQSEFDFVTSLEALEPDVEGAGNRERFKYYLNTFKAMKIMAEYACTRYQFKEAMDDELWSTALTHRRAMARLYEQFMELQIEKIASVSDLGEITSHEILDWHQLVEMQYDTALASGLGGPIPSDANPSTNYTGDVFIKVIPAQTMVDKDESLALHVLAMKNTSTPVLHYTILGSSTWSTQSLTHVARSVYEAAIPPQPDDFEYYITAQTSSGSMVYPVTAPSIRQTVIIMGTGENKTSRNTPYAWYDAHFDTGGWTPADYADADDEDDDSDGMKNWQEYQAGTDPDNAGSSFKIIGIDDDGSITWLGGTNEANRDYEIYGSTNLLNTCGWWKITNYPRRPEGIHSWTNPSSSYSNLFYKILAPSD